MENFQADIKAVNDIAAVPTILDVICRMTGMGFAAVARVTEQRWIACTVRDNIEFGLKQGSELKVESTICHEIRQNRQPVVINHVSEDEVYRHHHTPAMYGFQSYISMPILLPGGKFFGTLCAIDPRPAKINTPEIVGMFKLFAELIAFHLDAGDRLASTQSTLMEERKTAELREQFIAVLGHDLRNPLSAVSSGALLLSRTTLNERAASIVNLIQDSASRMAGLIDNVLDFARGRLGGGFTLDRNTHEPLEPVLDQVVAELYASWPGRAMEVKFDLIEPVYCDRRRIAQLFSNILGNALTYGAVDKPVRVRAVSDGQYFELSVANSGVPISPEAMKHLFQPFSRGAVRANEQGLGLGLYIAHEIARAHGGTLEIASSVQETRLTLRMPACEIKTAQLAHPQKQSEDAA